MRMIAIAAVATLATTSCTEKNVQWSANVNHDGEKGVTIAAAGVLDPEESDDSYALVYRCSRTGRLVESWVSFWNKSTDNEDGAIILKIDDQINFKLPATGAGNRLDFSESTDPLLFGRVLIAIKGAENSIVAESDQGDFEFSARGSSEAIEKVQIACSTDT